MRPDDQASVDPRVEAPGSTQAISRRVHAPFGVLALVSLWTVLAAVNPDVTYHLAPAVVAWSVPYLAGSRSALRGVLATAAGGFVVAVGTAAVLRGLGWLEGPVLVGGDAFGEALWVAAAATLVAIGVGLARRPRPPGHGTGSP